MKEKFVSNLSECPFCKTKRTSGEEKVCSVCKLNFSELSEGSNKQAKEMKLKKKFAESLEGEVVLCKIKPHDVDEKVVKNLSYGLGYTGLNHLYIGNFLRGFIILFCFIAAITLISIAPILKIDALYSISSVFSIVPIISWIADCTQVTKKTIKYPVKLKVPVDLDKFYDAYSK